jgi:hypothetical protein
MTMEFLCIMCSNLIIRQGLGRRFEGLELKCIRVCETSRFGRHRTENVGLVLRHGGP